MPTPAIPRDKMPPTVCDEQGWMGKAALLKKELGEAILQARKKRTSLQGPKAVTFAPSPSTGSPDPASGVTSPRAPLPFIRDGDRRQTILDRIGLAGGGGVPSSADSARSPMGSSTAEYLRDVEERLRARRSEGTMRETENVCLVRGERVVVERDRNAERGVVKGINTEHTAAEGEQRRGRVAAIPSTEGSVGRSAEGRGRVAECTNYRTAERDRST
eukprot:Sspe_Gene.89717::Locus_61406_Transcript_1_1_Confidence_1.000_Length_716::g.89717::m.89717